MIGNGWESIFRPVPFMIGPMLPAHLAGASDRAGADPTLPARAVEDALQSAITSRGVYRGDWWIGEESP